MWQSGKLKLSMNSSEPCICFVKRHIKIETVNHMHFIAHNANLQSAVHVWATKTHQFVLEWLQFWQLLCSHNNSAIISCSLQSPIDTLQWLIVWCLWFYEGILSLDWENQQLVGPMPSCCGWTKLPLFGRFSLWASPKDICLYILVVFLRWIDYK